VCCSILRLPPHRHVDQDFCQCPILRFRRPIPLLISEHRVVQPRSGAFRGRGCGHVGLCESKQCVVRTSSDLTNDGEAPLARKESRLVGFPIEAAPNARQTQRIAAEKIIVELVRPLDRPPLKAGQRASVDQFKKPGGGTCELISGLLNRQLASRSSRHGARRRGDIFLKVRLALRGGSNERTTLCGCRASLGC